MWVKSSLDFGTFEYNNEINIYFNKNEEYNYPYITNIKGTSIKKLKNNDSSLSSNSSENNEKIQ